MQELSLKNILFLDVINKLRKKFDEQNEKYQEKFEKMQADLKKDS